MTCLLCLACYLAVPLQVMDSKKAKCSTNPFNKLSHEIFSQVIDFLESTSIFQGRLACKAFRDAAPILVIAEEHGVDYDKLSIAYGVVVAMADLSSTTILRATDLDKAPHLRHVVMNRQYTDYNCRRDFMRRCLHGKPGKSVSVHYAFCSGPKVYTYSLETALMNHPRVTMFHVGDIEPEMKRCGNVWEGSGVYGFCKNDMRVVGGLYAHGYWCIRDILRELPAVREDDVVDAFARGNVYWIEVLCEKILLNHLHGRLCETGVPESLHYTRSPWVVEMCTQVLQRHPDTYMDSLAGRAGWRYVYAAFTAVATALVSEVVHDG